MIYPDEILSISPSVSIIIPVRNEANSIASCLDSIFLQDYPHELMEIIISDGLSTDNTIGIIKSYMDRSINMILLPNPGQIVSIGLNLAIAKAQGQIIIRVDGHTRLAHDYVRQCVETLKRTNACNVGGRMNATSDNTFGKVVALSTSTPFGVGNSRFHYSEKEEYVDSVYMGAWRRNIFENNNLFDEELVRDQDDEFNYRLSKNGGKILLNPRIVSSYTVRSSPMTLWKQYFQYGYWKVRVLQKHPRQMSLRQFVPLVFVISLLLSGTFAIFTDWGRWLLAFIAGSYLIANLAASVLTASQRGWKHLPLLPPIFAILHTSYGAGFLVGLVKFWNRWNDKQGKTPIFNTMT